MMKKVFFAAFVLLIVMGNAFSRWNHSSVTKFTPVRLIYIQALFFGDFYQT